MQLYAQVILPLPLFSTFTYSIPEAMEPQVKPGSRVLVNFGLRKFYTGIVADVVAEPPQGFEVKPIERLLDERPIVRPNQLKLWQWIGEYYLCSIGDVYKAAIPAGLKIESETTVEIDRDFIEDADNRLSEREMLILSITEREGRISVSDLAKASGLKSTPDLVARLVEQGALSVSERMIDRYRSQKKHFVRLNCKPGNEGDMLKQAFATVSRAKQQERMLLALVELSGFTSGNPMKEVEIDALLNRSGCSRAILNALRERSIVEIYTREINRFAFTDTPTGKLPALSNAQQAALNSIHTGFRDHDIVLLHGVTSSGKTEIYINLIDFVLRQGKQVLYLVPEIALTTQLTARLQRVFGTKVIIYHSKFTDNERVDIWRKLLNDHSPCVVIGARSSVFLPFSQLGLVIVDEEHETSYKQYDPAPRYNARDTATVLASFHGAKTLLGSATPSVETYYKAQNGRYGLVELTERYDNATMPRIQIIDMALERKRKSVDGLLSDEVVRMTREAIGRKEQVILFHNRRGFAPLARCKQCAYTPKCECCDVSLTYHRGINKLVCHYCGATYELPHICPACREPAIEILGYGTERIEEIVESRLPEGKIMRMDLDTTRNKDGYQQIINDFSAGKSNILVGTQMVTKGLDFGGVSLVGVLNADTLINFPDFRSTEHAFNMLQQVAGRAGRRQTQGVVAIQTYQPEHHIIRHILANDYTGYYNQEIEERRTYSYPPFTRIINIYLKHRDINSLLTIAELYGRRLRELFGNRVFGPDEPPVGRIQSLYIRKIMLKVETRASMKKVKEILRQLYESMHQQPQMRGVIIYYDVDPM